MAPRGRQGSSSGGPSGERECGAKEKAGGELPALSLTTKKP